MEYFNGWYGTTFDIIVGTLLALLCTGWLAIWCVQKRWHRHNAEIQGGLLLQMEVNGRLIAHIGMLTADEWHRKLRYEWSMSHIDRDDFPYTQMTDLPFTHIVVTQKRTEENLVTISVVDRKKHFWHADFCWIKDVTIGNQPGFPRQLLLPHNLVLKYFDSTLDP